MKLSMTADLSILGLWVAVIYPVSVSISAVGIAPCLPASALFLAFFRHPSLLKSQHRAG